MAPNRQPKPDSAETRTIRSDPMSTLQPTTTRRSKHSYWSHSTRKQKLDEAKLKYGGQDALAALYLPESHPYHGIPPAGREGYFRGLREYASSITGRAFSRLTTRAGEESVERRDADDVLLSPRPQTAEILEEKPAKTLWGSIRRVLGFTKKLRLTDGAATMPARLKTIGASFGRGKKVDHSRPVPGQKPTRRKPLSASLFEPPTQESHEAPPLAPFAIAGTEHHLPALLHHSSTPFPGSLEGPARLSDMILRAPDSIRSASTHETSSLHAGGCEDESAWQPESTHIGPMVDPLAAIVPAEMQSPMTPGRTPSSSRYTARNSRGEAVQSTHPEGESEISSLTWEHLRAERGETPEQTRHKVRERLRDVDDETMRELEDRHRRKRHLLATLITSSHDDDPVGEPRSMAGHAARGAATLPRGHRMPVQQRFRHDTPAHTSIAKSAITVSDPSDDAEEQPYHNSSSPAMSPRESANTSPPSTGPASRVVHEEYLDEPLSDHDDETSKAEKGKEREERSSALL